MALASLTGKASAQGRATVPPGFWGSLLPSETKLRPRIAPWEAVPEPPTLTTLPVVPVAPGAAQVHIPLTASGPVYITAWARVVRLANIPGGGFDVGSDTTRWAPFYDFYWRDGDDPTHWVTLDIDAPADVRSTPGNRFRVFFKIEGWANDTLETVVEVQPKAENVLPDPYPYHRPPKLIDFGAARPAAEADIPGMEWSDSGYVGNAPVQPNTLLPQDPAAIPCWRTRLFHGYAQGWNGELGVYLNDDAFPDDSVEPISKGTDEHGRPFVRMHTRRLDRPVAIGSDSYGFQAAVLNGQAMDEWCSRTGIYRAQVVLPSRIGAWSAFWACGRQKDIKGGRWPPEIDFFEHFNGAFGLADWPMDGSTTTAGQHAGPYGSNERARAEGRMTNLWRLGHDPDLNLFAQIHDYACLITEDRVIHFVDGIETLSAPNMAWHEDPYSDEWDLFPYFTVAVKPPDGPRSAYDDGSGDLLVYGIQRYDLGSGYTLSDWTEPKPWANRSIRPDPEISGA